MAASKAASPDPDLILEAKKKSAKSRHSVSSRVRFDQHDAVVSLFNASARAWQSNRHQPDGKVDHRADSSPTAKLRNIVS